MSDATNHVPPVQSEPSTAPAAPTLDATVNATKEREASLEKAQEAFKLCVKAFKKGEQGAKQGRLDAGKYAEQYISIRMSVGHSRESAVKALSGELAKYASSDTDTDVNLLIQVYHSHRLLFVPGENGTEERGEVPYGHYVNAFKTLVHRVDKASDAESWTLLPGMEADCISLFRDALVNGFNRADCKSKCKALVNVWVLKQAERMDAAAREADRKATEARQAANSAAADADKAPEADKLALQKVAAELNAAANTAEQTSKRAKTAAKTAKNRADKVSKSNAEPADESDKEPESSGNGKAPVHNPLVAAKQATPKDLAESIIAQLNANPAPDDVLCELFKALDLRRKHAAIIGKAIALNQGKHTLEFAFDLAGFLLDNLPEQKTATPNPRKTAAA